jgi:predicted  nucleic acid-binding Zn-ribbon protein
VEIEMTVTRQLFQLQEIDMDIEKAEQNLAIKTEQLGKREALGEALKCLNVEKQHLEEINRRHHDAEWAVDDLLGKIASTEKQLYSGKITNPKELSSLQHEVNTMRGMGDQLENKALEIIDEVETTEQKVASLTDAYQKLDDKLRSQQQQLTDEIEQLKKNLANLRQKRQEMTAMIEPSAVNLYERIRQQKKQAVAKVEQGICHACRISLSASILQKARSGQPVQCGTCGRILFLS